MKPVVELRVGPGGEVEGIYDDDLPSLLGAEIREVRRASNVEWEDLPNGKGWTVRSASDPHKAIRLRIGHARYEQFVGTDGELAIFLTREAALESEQRFFWDLVDTKRDSNAREG